MAKGDSLAQGAVRAQFQTPQVSQEKWDEAIGGEHRKHRGLTDEERALAETEILNQQQAELLRATVPLPKFRAIQDRIIVRRVETENKVGDLFLADESKEKPSEGIVLAVGPGRWVDGFLQSPTVNVGERVVFGKYAGAEVKFGVDPVLVLREEDIFMVKEN
jgi:chaperonin GroES